MNKLLFIISTLLVFTISCNNGKPKNFDYGKVENDRYVNSFFDLQIDLPSQWIIQTKEQTENLTEKGKDLISGDDKNMKAILNASEINTANLLAVFQYEIGSPVDYNPSFMLVAENLKAVPGIKNGSDYLFQARKLLKQSQIQFDSIDNEFKKVFINNQEYYLMNTSISLASLKIKQEYFCILKNGFCISAIISFVNDEQKNILEKIVNSMIFKK